MIKELARRFTKTATILLLLYIFLVSISLLSDAFKMFGTGFAHSLIQTTSNPFVGLFIGILATSLIQSSSTTTSIIVGFVASGALTVENAIPMVMGANIGTTVTNTLVSLAHITRKEEFKRAMACSSLHDIFNILTVMILFPLELATGYLRHSASFLANIFGEFAGVKVMSPLKAIIKPAIDLVKHTLLDNMGLSEKATGILMLVLAMILLFTALLLIVRVMKSSTAKRAEIVFNKILGRSGVIGIFMGLIFTAIVQSSSVTTSILVPIVASGITTVEVIFPITMGANLGTTVTAILASLTGNVAGITIAFAHLLFNLTGTIVVYNIPLLKNGIINASKKLAAVCAERKPLAFVYALGVFYGIPALFIFISKFFK
ncbi:MAG: Na/Pi symporter [Candidatus Omnitrophota bacterium]